MGVRSNVSLRAFLGLAITIATVTGSEAQNNKSATLDEVIVFAGNSQRAYTADLRTKFAQALANYCKEVLHSLPTNTPTEEAWVTAEGKNIDGSKLQRLINSKEYSRSELKSTFTDCNDITALLIQIQQLPNKGAIDSRLEAAQFVRLALNFNSSLESYAAKVELNKDVKFTLGDLHRHVVRTGLLRAALEALQESQR